MPIEFTDRAYVRSHGRTPSGRGSWGFCQVTAPTAFESEQVGEVAWFQGTLTEAKRQARKHFAPGSTVAVMP